MNKPVAINYLKRFAADYEKSVDKPILPYKAPASGKKIAVIGGGVEGLSTAFFSARLGHEVTVFEATPQLGGLLRMAIARNRLPLRGKPLNPIKNRIFKKKSAGFQKTTRCRIFRAPSRPLPPGEDPPPPFTRVCTAFPCLFPIRW